MRKVPIVVFDIEGVANLAFTNFQEMLLNLSRREIDFIFWTGISNREYAMKKLVGYGMHIPPDKIISAEEARFLRETLGNAAKNLHEENQLREELYERVGLTYESEDLNHAIAAASPWENFASKTIPAVKFPPALGCGPFLWIESDNAFIDPDMPRRILGTAGSERIVLEAKKLIGSPFEFSLLMIPEEPIYPYAVASYVERALERWNGEPLVRWIERSYNYQSTEGQHRRKEG